jgi:excisionase family DNA binding protein
MEERYLSLSEATRALGISERTAYRWINSGKLRAYKPGRDYRIPESAIREAVEGSKVRPKAPAPPSSIQPPLNGFEEERRSEASPTVGEIAAIRRWLSYLEQRLNKGNLTRDEIAHDLDAARAFGIGKEPGFYPTDLVGNFLQIGRRALEEGKSFDTLQTELASLEAEMDQVEEVYAEAKEQQT